MKSLTNQSRKFRLALGDELDLADNEDLTILSGLDPAAHWNEVVHSVNVTTGNGFGFTNQKPQNTSRGQTPPGRSPKATGKLRQRSRSPSISLNNQFHRMNLQDEDDKFEADESKTQFQNLVDHATKKAKK